VAENIVAQSNGNNYTIRNSQNVYYSTTINVFTIMYYMNTTYCACNTVYCYNTVYFL
jgi:hypothetical protein